MPWKWKLRISSLWSICAGVNWILHEHIWSSYCEKGTSESYLLVNCNYFIEILNQWKENTQGKTAGALFKHSTPIKSESTKQKLKYFPSFWMCSVFFCHMEEVKMLNTSISNPLADPGGDLDVPFPIWGRLLCAGGKFEDLAWNLPRVELWMSFETPLFVKTLCLLEITFKFLANA